MCASRTNDGPAAGFQRKPLTIRRIAGQLSTVTDGSDFKNPGEEVAVVVLNVTCKFMVRIKKEARKWSKMLDDREFRTQVGWYEFVDECITNGECMVQGYGLVGPSVFDIYFDTPMYRKVMAAFLIKIGGKFTKINDITILNQIKC